MRFLNFIIFSFMFCSIIHTQDSKKISEKYFPDFDIEVPTPAFNKKKGFGFVKNINDPSEDIFFHFSDIQSVGYKILYPGEFVSMDIGTNNDNQPICRNIRGVGGLALLTDNPSHHYRVMPKRDNNVSQ